MRLTRALLIVTVVGLYTASAGAQRPMRTYDLHYDTSTVTTISGEVLGVQSPAPGARGLAGVQVLMRTGQDSLVVHLGPSWHLEQNGIALVEGDRIEVTGSRVVIAGRPALIAAELRKGTRALKLRDARGVPQWIRPGGAGPR